ncbi:MAG TPA: hypothetical protein VFC44_10840 [Candidatus Saccharimonadales bacterium]|nr:hypothetical protein [Candidatus Saccharimonadales bacterium]
MGTAYLPQTPSFAPARKIFSLPSTRQFEDLVYSRVAQTLAQSLQLQMDTTTITAIRSLLDDATQVESVGSFGGASGHPLNFVFAFRLDKKRAQAWQQALEQASHRSGESFRADAFTGSQWNKGATNSFWIVPARDWMVVGRGDDLANVRLEFLRQIQKTGEPSESLRANWFEADVDWARLAQWLPLSSCPLKLGRTQIGIGAQGRDFIMDGRITYREPMQWHPQPWRTPTNLVREPLLAFSTGQDVQAFFNSTEAVSRLGATLFEDQFYFWAMGEMPFESYLAWPVQNATNAMRDLAPRATALLNPDLKKIDGTELVWHAGQTQLLWTKLQLIAPFLQSASGSGGQFLLATLFSLTRGTRAAPSALWEQFKNRSDLVYYDWELTGPRLLQLRTLTQMLPVLQWAGLSTDAQKSAGDERTRLNLEEHWLAGLTPELGNTVTQITKSGPSELKVVRKSPFVFTSLELVLLSHWLTGTPAGPINFALLPQAKMSGPGLPSH